MSLLQKCLVTVGSKHGPHDRLSYFRGAVDEFSNNDPLELEMVVVNRKMHVELELSTGWPGQGREYPLYEHVQKRHFITVLARY